jgi:hypothetical protein
VRPMFRQQASERDLADNLRRAGALVGAILVVSALVALARTQLRHRPHRHREEWKRIR